jgi:hypothetical protein
MGFQDYERFSEAFLAKEGVEDPESFCANTKGKVFQKW